MADGLEVVELGAGRTAKQIVAGYSHNCAILDNSQVECWGCASYCLIFACITSLAVGSATFCACVAFEVSETCRALLCTDSVHAYTYLFELVLSEEHSLS